MEGGITPQPHPTGAPPAYQDALKVRTSVNDYYIYIYSKYWMSSQTPPKRFVANRDELDTTDQTPLNP